MSDQRKLREQLLRSGYMTRGNQPLYTPKPGSTLAALQATQTGSPPRTRTGGAFKDGSVGGLPSQSGRGTGWEGERSTNGEVPGGKKALFDRRVQAEKGTAAGQNGETRGSGRKQVQESSGNSKQSKIPTKAADQTGPRDRLQTVNQRKTLRQLEDELQEQENHYYFLKGFESDMLAGDWYEPESEYETSAQAYKKVEALRREIEDRKYQMRVDSHEGTSHLPGFKLTAEWTRAQEPAKTIPFWQGNLAARSVVRGIQSGDMSALADRWKYLSEEQEDMLLYYAGTNQWDRATDYMELVEDGLNAQAAEAQRAKVSGFAEEHPVMGSVLSVPASLLGGAIGAVDLLGQNINRAVTGERVDYNSEGQRIGAMANQLRAPVREQIEENTSLTIPEGVPLVGGRNVAGLLYDTAMAGADSLAAGGLFKGARAAGLLLSGGAAGNAARDVAARGGSDDQALMSALVAGAFEGLFESVSIGNLKAMKELPAETVKDVVWNVGKSMGVNASEEGMTEAANLIWDTLTMGDISKWQTSIRRYMEQGLSEREAKQRTAVEFGDQVLEASFSGGLMGVGFGTAGAVKGVTSHQSDYAHRIDQDSIELTTTDIGDKITGARITDQYSKRAEEHAERYYGLIRSMRTDVERIAQSTGYSQDEIRQVKNHLFIKEHDLGEEGIRPFDADFAIAQSWQRLISGKPKPHDLTLLQHELMESKLMEEGMTQDEAHILASRKYNYAKEAAKFYGAPEKH